MKQIALLLLTSICWVAAPTSSVKAQSDTTEVLRKLVPDSVANVPAYLVYLRDRLTDTAFSENMLRIEQVALHLNQELSTSFDTLELSRELPGIELLTGLLYKNLYDGDNTFNLRSLHMGKVALTQFGNKLGVWQNILVSKSQKLRATNKELARFITDTTFRQLPADSSLRKLYMTQLSELAKNVLSVMLENQNKLVQISLWQGRVAKNYLQVQKLDDAFGKEIHRRNSTLLRPEIGVMGVSDTISAYRKPYSEVLKVSFMRNRELVKYYVRQHYTQFGFLLLAWAGLSFWLLVYLRRIRKSHLEYEKVLDNAGFAGKFPVSAALVTVLAITPLLFVNPPIGFLQIIWMLQIILMSALVFIRVNWVAKMYWAFLLLAFFCYSNINLSLVNNYTERDLMLVLNVLCIITGVLFLIKPRYIAEAYRNFLKPLTWVMIGFQIFGIVLLILGRFTLAKIVSVGALFNIVLAIELYIAVDFIKSAIYIQVEAVQAQNEPNRQAAQFDWERIKKQFNNILHWVAIFLWVIALAQNFNVFEYLNEAARTFLSTERKVGNSRFTFGSIGIFLLIVWLASLISGLITQLFGGFKQQFVGVQKGRIGSAMLLVRLGVIAGGFLLAVSASGIPLDKLAIVFGALGVGIGFGLQNIVNNLVSGIILAFEKPLQVGDLIEVGTRKGIVREIGFRASKISTYDGSDVIVPNGDLISQHLINWTMNGRHQRVELLVGVAYGTDLDLARKIMVESCDEEDKILNFPVPLALVHEFTDNAVNLRLLFWISDVDFNLSIKSSLLNKLYERFDAAGINIPFPQVEMHIRSIDPLINSMNTPESTQEKSGKMKE